MKNTIISKMIFFSALTALGTNVNAQYSGGNGRGDISARTATCSSYATPTNNGYSSLSLIHGDGADLYYVSSRNLSGQCVSLARIIDAVGGNVLGTTTVGVDLHLVAQQNSTQRFVVPRVININPTSDGNADITFNYTQADFNEFNSKAVHQKSMPTSSADVANIANFKLYRSATSSFNTAEIIQVPATLTWNATNNLWEVSMVNQTAGGYYFISTDFNTALVAGPLTTTPVTPLTDDQRARVNVDWADVVGATRYVVRHRPVGASINAWEYDTVNTSNISLGNLFFTTDYEVQVRVRINSQLHGQFSDLHVFTTPNQLPVCGFPDTITHNVTSSTSATLNWTAATNALNYQVRYRVANTLYWGGTSTSSLARTLNYLTGSTEYEYQIRTRCVLNTTRSQWGSFSAIAKFTTPVAPPNVTCLPPTNLSTTINGGNSVTINWDTAANANFYLVQLKRETDTVWGGSSTNVNTRTFNFLSANTKYYYRIRTRCNDGSTSNVNSSFTAVDSFTTPSSKSLPGWGIDNFGENWVVYPNPTSDVVNLQFSASKDAEIVVNVCDMTGRIVKSEVHSAVMGANVINMNIAEVVNGLYTVQVIQDNNVRFVSKINKKN